ncbi:MAG: dihydroorotase [Gammaproteobacteria bacterium]|nr:MAG: dihydroorotase [Gammaproteobacteria bacterium]
MRLIRGGRVIDPANNVDALQDIWINDGLISAETDDPGSLSPDEIIDASNCWVVPGLVDLAARFREPGQEHKANIQSESMAALAGGITTVCIPPDTIPVMDTPAVVDLIQQCAHETTTPRIETLGAMSVNLQGQQLSEIGALKNAGCIGISNAMRSIRNSQFMRNIMDYAVSHQLKVYLTPLDEDLAGDGCVHEGKCSTRMGLPGIPAVAETTALARDLALVEATGVEAHFCRISCARSVEMIVQAQKEGLKVTADVAAHQLFMTENDIFGFDSLCHVRPPFRTMRDRDALRQAIQDNIVTAICSDHQPHEADAKLAPFGDTEPGISALETLLPLVLKLVHEGFLNESQAIAAITNQPAEILGVNSGKLTSGMPADITIIDPNLHWWLETENINSRGKNTPFEGWEFQGKVRHTLISGTMIYTSS